MFIKKERHDIVAHFLPYEPFVVHEDPERIA